MASSSSTSAASQKSSWLLYVLASLFSLGVVVFLSLIFGKTSVWDRVSNLFAMSKEQTLLVIPAEGEDLSNVPLPFALLVSQADSAFAAGNLADAERLYEKALALASENDLPSGSDVPVIRKLFSTALLLKKADKAESMLGLLSFRGMGEESLDALRGFLLLRQDNREGARALFSNYPESPEHAYGLTLLHILENAHEEAETSLAIVRKSADPLLVHAAETLQGAYDEFALFEDGKESHRATLLARSLAQVNQCPVAEVLLQEVTEEEKDYRDAWIIFGYCKLVLQNPEGALSAFEEAYALDPEKAETQYFLGLAHERLGKSAEARTFFQYALQNGFEPERAVREKLAMLSRSEGAYEDAAAQYRAMITLGGEDTAVAYHALATLLINHLNDAAGARTLALEAREKLGDVPLTLDLLGWTELLTGDINQAAAYLNAAVQQDPSLASAWYHKGLLAERVGDMAEALESYREAYTLALGHNEEIVKNAAERHNALVKQ